MKGVFKCTREDDERRFGSVKRSSLGMPPCIPNKYSRILKRLSLGCPCASPSPSTIISLSFVSLYFYHFMRYVLCLERLALRFYFQFSLALLAVHNKLDPVLLCVGEKHAPLSKSRTHHRILRAYLLLLCVLYLFIATALFSFSFSFS